MVVSGRFKLRAREEKAGAESPRPWSKRRMLGGGEEEEEEEAAGGGVMVSVTVEGKSASEGGLEGGIIMDESLELELELLVEAYDRLSVYAGPVDLMQLGMEQ